MTKTLFFIDSSHLSTISQYFILIHFQQATYLMFTDALDKQSHLLLLHEESVEVCTGGVTVVVQSHTCNSGKNWLKENKIKM